MLLKAPAPATPAAPRPAARMPLTFGGHDDPEPLALGASADYEPLSDRRCGCALRANSVPPSAQDPPGDMKMCLARIVLERWQSG